MHNGVGILALAVVSEDDSDSLLRKLQRCVFSKAAAAAGNNCDTLRHKNLVCVIAVVEQKLISCYEINKECLMRITVSFMTTISSANG